MARAIVYLHLRQKDVNIISWIRFFSDRAWVGWSFLPCFLLPDSNGDLVAEEWGMFFYNTRPGQLFSLGLMSSSKIWIYPGRPGWGCCFPGLSCFILSDSIRGLRSVRKVKQCCPLILEMFLLTVLLPQFQSQYYYQKHHPGCCIHHHQQQLRHLLPQAQASYSLLLHSQPLYHIWYYHIKFMEVVGSELWLRVEDVDWKLQADPKRGNCKNAKIRNVIAFMF